MANENQLIEVRVPDIGNYKDVEVIDVLFKQGDAVEVDTPLITLETEKATMDVPSTAAGVVREARLQRGSRVSQGDVIAVVEMSATSPAATSPAPAGEVARSAGEGRKSEPSPQPSPASAGEGARPSPRPSPAGAGEGGGPARAG
ncbi:MAG TPA: biotin/lipoyl-containing protein, partial [Steroidobacteraceae bacterium]|nr:biotin/lipoyl-containing protein [Steroidobacteraceae bacterium]